MRQAWLPPSELLRCIPGATYIIHNSLGRQRQQKGRLNPHSASVSARPSPPTGHRALRMPGRPDVARIGTSVSVECPISAHSALEGLGAILELLEQLGQRLLGQKAA